MNQAKINKWWNLAIANGKLLAFCLLLVSQVAFARAPEESEFSAASILGEDIANWINKLDSEHRPDSIAIYSCHANPPFDGDFSGVMENEIMKYLSKKGFSKVTTCVECRTAQVSVQEDRVVITKGAPDMESIKKAAKYLATESFLVVEIYRTKFNMIAQATLYTNPNGQLISAERFTVPALSLNEASVQLLLTFGFGKVLNGPETDKVGYVSAASISLLEELGFGKGGLNLGMVLPKSGSLIYINPTLSFRGRFGMSNLGYSLNLGVGYGFGGGSKGFVVKGSYEIYIGSLTTLGFEGLYYLPETTTTTGTSPASSPSSANPTSMRAFAGVHLGLSFGR